jgi:hypothetical protein
MPTPGDLAILDPGEIARLPVDVLVVLQRETDESLKQAKAAKDRFDAALAIRYAGTAAERRQAAGKDTGTVRLEDGPVTVVADLPKKVDWDQGILADVVARIQANDDDPAEYVDTVLKVSERKYAAWPAPIRAVFEPARTVRPGKPTFTLKMDGGQ